MAQAASHFPASILYVEYGIAQLGALQIWVNSKRDKPGALRAYHRDCRWRLASIAGTVSGGRLHI